MIETLRMKKFKLEISKPCHQDWNTMTTEEQGRFCKSCQKTVIDFTGMSDRQLAEFFRKPKGEVCGRLYNDQLERAIAIPKKRIPWLRYFFQFTWPAFVFFLKSCGLKNSTIGKAQMEISTTQGIIDNHQKPVFQTDSSSSEISFFPVSTVKNIEIKVSDSRLRKIEDSPVLNQTDPNNNEADSLFPFPETVMDTVRIESGIYGVVGRLSVNRCTSVSKTVEVEKKTSSKIEKKIPGFNVYPNPVSQGNLLTVNCSDIEGVPDLVQIFSSGGQLVYSLEQKPSEESLVFNIRIPVQVPAGIYFLRMINKKNNQQHTEKIMVK
jgi:hypothetical protein